LLNIVEDYEDAIFQEEIFQRKGVLSETFFMPSKHFIFAVESTIFGNIVVKIRNNLNKKVILKINKKIGKEVLNVM